MESDSDSSNLELEYYEKPEMKRFFYYHSRINKMGQINGWSKLDTEFENNLKSDELKRTIEIETKKKKKNCISRSCGKKVSNEYGVCKKCYDYYVKNVFKESLTNTENIIKKYKNQIVQKEVESNIATCVKCNYILDFKYYNIMFNIKNDDKELVIENNKFETFSGEWICPLKNGGCGDGNKSCGLINKNDYNKIISILEDKKEKKIKENTKKYNETSYKLVRNYILENVNN